MSVIVQFPGAPPPEGYPEGYIDKLHSEVFRDLEMSLRDCAKMRGVAAQLMFNANLEDRQLSFAVFHAAEMLTQLEKEYDARWHGERRGS
jgi:hypothetical protein